MSASQPVSFSHYVFQAVTARELSSLPVNYSLIFSVTKSHLYAIQRARFYAVTPRA